METKTLDFILKACGGKLAQGLKVTAIKRVCTDSRQAGDGDLFIALAGERFDAHQFLPEVARQDVAAVVVERAKVIPVLQGCAIVVVDNARRALGQLAAEYRKEFSLPVVAVGGSNGKTTTKELIASVLSQKLLTLWSEASFNNDIGVPLTLLRLESSHRAAVLEVGTNHPGELAPLVKIVQPKYGVITNIGREHLEFFGDIEGVAKEEGTLAELLPADGKLFLNGDNEWSASIAKRTPAKVVRVGTGEGNDWRVSQIRLEKNGMSFRVANANAELSGEYGIGFVGRHQALNALFAIALGAELGLSRAEIERGLAECQAPKMRLQLWELN
ncbi:MAG: UDP-N-acetylmuramoyl-tripeptide--D-alanyl-D-alanine ligase, partial [Verrucomicrobiota bacterium]